MLKNLPVEHFSRLLNDGSAAFLSSGVGEQYNLMAISWHTPISQNPPLLGVSISPACWSHELILASGEFALSIPDVQNLTNLHITGTRTGKGFPKVQRLNLMVQRGEMIRAPYVVGCIGYLECEVRAHYRLGDHTLFVAEVLCASVDDEFFDDYWTEDAETLHYLGGNRYLSGGRVLRGTP